MPDHCLDLDALATLLTEHYENMDTGTRTRSAYPFLLAGIILAIGAAIAALAQTGAGGAG